MKKQRGLLYTLLGIGVIAMLIFITYRSEQPEPVKLNFSEKPQTKEHALVGEILADTEGFIAEEETSVNQTEQLKLSAPVPLPVAGNPLPVAWESEPAPDIGETELSPSLQRSLAASASLRSEAYTNPSSELNLERVENIRAIRKQRQEGDK